MKKIILLIYSLILISLINCTLYSDSYNEGDPFPKPYEYHSPEELQAFLIRTEADYPDITDLITIGYSVEGRPINVLVISDNPGTNEPGEPRVRFTGSIHGNEYIAGEILIDFIMYLTQNYDPQEPSNVVTELVNGSYIAVIPILNPDGIAAGVRYNSNGVDLNRNFSTEWVVSTAHGDSPFSEPESSALRDYSVETVFHLSATYHSGTVIVNMPFDYASESNGIIPGEYDLVKYIARLYSGSGIFLQNPDILADPDVDSGTINGGDWYIVYGSLQDWSYKERGCLDLTIEVAKESPQTLEGIEEVFLYNRDSMIEFIFAAGTGIYGKVIDENGSSMPGVSVYLNDGINDGDLITVTDSDGYYYKIVRPGDYSGYSLKFSAAGYPLHTETIAGIISDGGKVEINVQLMP